MKTGAEPKKLAFLGGLLLLAAVILYFNVFSGDSNPAPKVLPPPVVADPVSKTPPAVATSKPERRRATKAGITSEFKIRQGVEVGEVTFEVC